MNRHDERPIQETSNAELESMSVMPAKLCETGFRLRSAGRPLEALQYCQQALAIDGDHADALHLVGLLSFDSGHYEHAVEWIARAIRIDPKVEYLNHLGAALQRQKRYDEALKAIEKAIQFKPDCAVLWRHLGDVLAQLNRDNDALLSYEHALKLQPNDLDAVRKSDALPHQQAHFDLSEALDPNHAPTLHLRAIAHRKLRNYQGYLADSLRAHALEPDNAESCNNVGDALQSLGREEEAIAWFDKALMLLPDNPTVLTNKACAITQLQRLEEAAAIYSHIGKIAPDYALAEWNLALLKLLTGDFAAGWAGREARWRIPSLSAHYPKFDKPMWRGDVAIVGKTILIHVEEGFGDTIQFARYAPMVAARGARVLLVVADELQQLMSGLTGVVQCLPLSANELPDFDMHCPLSSLPFIFGTTLDTIPSETTYLPQPASERIRTWEDRLGPRDRPRIGLVWSGGLSHKNDLNRSIPLRMFTHILDVHAIFVSLQKDPRPADRIILDERSDIIDPTARLSDFAETAALLSCLDLVVTVDTSVAHLAGAMGRPTWIILPFTPDYRWLLHRDDSPWYPSMRLFRQDAARDYAPVLDRIRTELLTFERKTT